MGHALAARLGRGQIRCRILTRHPQRHRDLGILPGISLVQGDVFDAEFLREQFAGCEAVINLVGILNEKRRSRGAGFRRYHVELVERVIAAAQQAGVQRYLHMSALNANPGGPSQYLKSKGEGEALALGAAQAGLRVTSFRPSVIFGPGDGLFNRFADLLAMAPGVVPLACPDARFQPVFVGDVADAFARALDDPNTWGQSYDLCGLRQLSLREILAYTAQLLGRRVLLVGLGDRLSRLQARVLDFVPGRPFTPDNYLSMGVNSCCAGNDLARFGIRQRGIEEIVPLYLGHGAQRDRYNLLRQKV